MSAVLRGHTCWIPKVVYLRTLLTADSRGVPVTCQILSNLHREHFKYFAVIILNLKPYAVCVLCNLCLIQRFCCLQFFICICCLHFAIMHMYLNIFVICIISDIERLNGSVPVGSVNKLGRLISTIVAHALSLAQMADLFFFWSTPLVFLGIDELFKLLQRPSLRIKNFTSSSSAT